MNSLSKHDPCNQHEHDHHHEEDFRAVIKCGAPRSATIPVTAAALTTFNVGSLSLNTTGLRDANIKFEFASNISADVDFVGTLSFQIMKTCPNQINPMPVGPAWIYTHSPIGRVISNTFSFFLCDCDSCFNDCCIYTVVVTKLSAASAPGTAGTVSINNATLRAEAFSGDTRCC